MAALEAGLAVYKGKALVNSVTGEEERLEVVLADSQVHKQVVRKRAECSPCFLRECPIDFRCMKEVEAATVAEALRGVLSS